MGPRATKEEQCREDHRGSESDVSPGGLGAAGVPRGDEGLHTQRGIPEGGAGRQDHGGILEVINLELNEFHFVTGLLLLYLELNREEIDSYRFGLI